MPAKPSTWAWTTVHLVFPLMPVALEGLLRAALARFRIDLNTFSASTLALSCGMICLFVNQSLRAREQEDLATNKADEGDRNGACTLFIMLALGFGALFTAVVLMNAIVNDHKEAIWQPVLEIFQWMAYVTWVIPAVMAVVVQRSFGLRASLA